MKTAKRFGHGLFERFALGEGFAGADEVHLVESVLVQDSRLDVVVEEDGVVGGSGGDTTLYLLWTAKQVTAARGDEAVAIADEVHAGDLD